MSCMELMNRQVLPIPSVSVIYNSRFPSMLQKVIVDYY